MNDCICQHVGYCDGSCQFSEQDANLPTSGFWERVDTADYAEIHPEGKKAKQPIALVAKGADADLIAAAPLMFWALQEAHKVFKWYDRFYEDRMAVLGIERALKVAKGEK